MSRLAVLAWFACRRAAHSSQGERAEPVAGARAGLRAGLRAGARAAEPAADARAALPRRAPCHPFSLAAFLLFLLSTACSAQSVDLVLAHYKEPVADVKAFVALALKKLRAAEVQVFIYCQGGDPLEQWDDSWQSRMLPNMNHEAHAYTAYLAEFRSRETDFVWFTQALPNGIQPHRKYLWNRLSHFSPSTGMLGLCGVGSGTCRGAGPRLYEVYAMARHEFCTDDTTWTIFFNGEFIVSRKRILRHPSWFYEALHNSTSSNEAPFAQGDAGAATPVTIDYHFGYIMEATWTIIFDCMHPPRTPYISLRDVWHKSREFQCLD